MAAVVERREARAVEAEPGDACPQVGQAGEQLGGRDEVRRGLRQRWSPPAGESPPHRSGSGGRRRAVTTRTVLSAMPTTGSTVPKLISMTGVAAAESVRSQAVRWVTVATFVVLGRGRAVSCRVGTQPG